MTEEPLAEILLRMAQGERAALRNLYSEAGPKLFGVCIRMLKDRAEAEDALQEILVKLWSKAHQFDPRRGRSTAWAVTIARNHCLDRLRARTAALQREATGSNERAMLEVADTGPGPETLVEMKDEARRISDCLATLEADRATAIRSAYLDGHSYDAIARALGIPVNTLRSWLHRGLRKLKECMDA
ncbi:MULTISPECIES: sigma-70 family RNA polymerase sigma factor [Rhodobacterales]|uniref:sigma-70 family RNA polymerase sigma factor n=1 Tax=Rhodobacterales TaxID=204455 RepID=UPI001C95F821|nr:MULTISPECIES: sigma-70 family RNA polymerase sigma factor [Rhodobacterales]MBY6092380.1 sigma-70 family RNA polymerase sigma factor [Maritimibacter alkaliphilus]MCA0922187.1 sigma-70 family RNA polymerase sigma factor [Pseudooceanicola nanhaiensis]